MNEFVNLMLTILSNTTHFQACPIYFCLSCKPLIFNNFYPWKVFKSKPPSYRQGDSGTLLSRMDGRPPPKTVAFHYWPFWSLFPVHKFDLNHSLFIIFLKSFLWVPTNNLVQSHIHKGFFKILGRYKFWKSPYRYQIELVFLT